MSASASSCRLPASLECLEAMSYRLMFSLQINGAIFYEAHKLQWHRIPLNFIVYSLPFNSLFKYSADAFLFSVGVTMYLVRNDSSLYLLLKCVWNVVWNSPSVVRHPCCWQQCISKHEVVYYWIVDASQANMRSPVSSYCRRVVFVWYISTQ